MNFNSLTQSLEDSDVISDFVLFYGETEDNCLCINGYVALPIGSLAPHIDSDEDIEIIDDYNILLGYLCLTKSIYEVSFTSLTESQQIAYLTEIDDHQISTYVFKNNYLVIDVKQLSRYKHKYMPTSSIWGGFQEASNTEYLPYKVKFTKIYARSGFSLPTDAHKSVAVTSTLDRFSLERYLKLYHLLELGFDWDIVNQIKLLGNDMKGIGKILGSYGGNEVDLLKKIISKSYDIKSLEIKLSVVFDDSIFDKAIEIFFHYEKETNPLKNEKKDKFVALKDRGGFSFENAKNEKLASKADEYETLIKNIAAYWIYRTRCGIAHHRIGEYIITLDDEHFIVDFMEPLIKEIICQVFHD